MNLQRNLIFYYLAPIFSILLIFGFMAYQFTSAVSQQNHEHKIDYSVKHHAHILSEAYARNPSSNALIKHAVELSGHDYLLQILDDNYLALKSQDTVDEWYPVLGKIHTLDSRQGKITLDDHTYYWIRTVIPDSPYHLLELTLAHDETPISELTTRMLTAGAIILWFALWIGIVIANTLSKKFQAQTDTIQYQSMHDSLTHLPNRILLQRELKTAIAMAKAQNTIMALIVMDLNRFKEINDTLGHDVGDQLLYQIAKRLQQPLKDVDTLARMGGDEFAILVNNTNREQVKAIVENVLQVLETPFNIKNLLLEAEASIGIALCPDDGTDVRTLIRHADTAMYVAKQGHDRFAFYEQQKDPHSLKRLTLMVDLRRAIEDDELELYYQPKIDVATRRTISVEALTRWQHPIYGSIQPDVFITLAEQTGIIRPLTHWTLESSIRQCLQWHQQGIMLTVAVNLSSRMLQNISMPDEIKALLDKYGLAPQYLELEITESAIIHDPERALVILNRLDKMGITLSIDDFGTGYTSLSQLNTLPVDEIKIDMSFIQNMLKDKNNTLIVESIIQLAHNMGFRVIAEGVENSTVFNHLLKKGCDIVQGEYISHALNVAAFENWLANSEWNTPSAYKSRAALKRSGVIPLTPQ